MREMRRTEYREDRPEVAGEILDRATHGYLSLVGEDGFPVVKPMNYARLGDRLYFHGATKGEKAEQRNSPASFVVAEPLAWVPSTWRHPEMACPATTYFRSVIVRGRLRVVEELAEKAEALQQFMTRYQPEGGYSRITAEDPRYRGPLAALLVFSLDLAGASCKVKVGQNLDPASRRKVYERLLQRDQPGDYEAARRMAEVDPSLSKDAPLLPLTEDGVTFTDRPEAVDPEQLRALLDTTYWAAQRTPEQVRRLLAGSTLVVAALLEGRLAGFARIVSDGATHALLLDVVVDPALRGRGLGRRVCELLLKHPRLAHVPRVRLDTRDKMRFYERFGFKKVGTRETSFGLSTTMYWER